MDGLTEAVFRRDRLVVISGIVALSLLTWAWTVWMGWDMQGMYLGEEMVMPHMHAWTSGHFLMMFAMWSVMMVAMMVPTAAPMVLTFSRVNRKRRARQQPYVSTSIFLGGYLVAWTGYSLLATFLQWGLESAALLSPAMASRSALFGGGLLIATGLFQFTPLKQACLKHCRTPFQFLLQDWRDGKIGAFLMGLNHGGYCLGCCWFLMLLLFVAGVMNLLWMAAITVFVLLEKVAPRGDWIGRAGGVLMVGAGGWLLWSGAF